MAGNTLNQRISVSLDNDTYDNLLEIASKNDVSIAWVIRYVLRDFLGKYGGTEQQQLLLPLKMDNNR